MVVHKEMPFHLHSFNIYTSDIHTPIKIHTHFITYTDNIRIIVTYRTYRHTYNKHIDNTAAKASTTIYILSSLLYKMG